MELKGCSLPENKKRIIELLQLGFTLQMVGDIFGVTRERIRQVYRKETKDTAKNMPRLKIMRIAREKDRKINEEKIAFYCKGCKTPVKKKERKGSFFLCKKCRLIQDKEQRDVYILRKCEWCKKEYHPFRNITKKMKKEGKKPRFCSNECFTFFKEDFKKITGRAFLPFHLQLWRKERRK